MTHDAKIWMRSLSSCAKNRQLKKCDIYIMQCGCGGVRFHFKTAAEHLNKQV